MSRLVEPYEPPPDTVPDPVLHKARGDANACGQRDRKGQPSGMRVDDWRHVTCDVCLALPVPAKRRIT